jgi:hypothetical protein
MHSSDDNNNNSIRNVLFDAAVQLSVPTVTSTASVATKPRTNSITEDTLLSSRSRSPSNKSKSSFSSNSNYFRRNSNLKNSKVLRDVATQSSPVQTKDDNNHQHRSKQLDSILDNNNNPTKRSSTISETSKEYLSAPQHDQYEISSHSSPTRSSKSLKNTLIGLWQGLNSDELTSTATSPIDVKNFEDRVRIVI